MRNSLLTAAPLVLVLVGAAAGCASHPAVPVADLTRAQTLVAQAQASDAPRYDSVDLTEAQDKLQQANANAQSNPAMAAQFAQQASANAQLALARTRTREAQESLAQVNGSLAALRAQTNQLGQDDQEQGDGVAAPAAPPVSSGGQ